MTDTEKAALERRIDELCAEVEYDRQTSRSRLERIDQLKAENAKLRKELSDIYTLHWHGLDCTECPWFDECDTTDGCLWLFILYNHMRELGIEVPS